MYEVYLNRCSEYNLETLTGIFKAQFDAMGIDKEIRPGMTVVVKPNLILRSKPEENMITHPTVVEAVGLYVKGCGGKVLIAESSGGPYTPAYAKSIFNGCGYQDMANRNGFMLYTECRSTSVFLKDAKLCKNLSVLDPFIDADYIIDVAKIKTHGMMGMSGAVKNLFGVVPGLMKPELHCRFPDKSDFAHMLIDLCEYVKPNLSVIDGVYGMEGNGPTGGETRFVGAVMSSRNPYALDVAAADLIGIRPDELYQMKNAAERGLSPESVGEIRVYGDSIDSLRVADFKRAKSSSIDFVDRAPAFLRPFLTKIATPKPRIRKKDCIGCGKCAESCPQKIISIENKLAVIQLKSCISCFCCHEMCPKQAIDIKRLGAFKL